MINFRPINISDKGWVDELLAYSDYRGAEYCFTNLFIWEGVYNSTIARYKDFLLIRSGRERSWRYLYPAGRGDRREVIETIRADAEEKGGTFSIIGLTSDTKRELEAIFPNKFHFTPIRDSYDYLYDSEKLISLSGKKLQSKRNHINYFTTHYEWSYEDMAVNKLEEVKAFNEEWCRISDCSKNKTLELECCAVQKCLKEYSGLGVAGGIIRADGKMVAFTVGERINSDTAIIHIEKALPDIRGAYPMINREFARLIAPNLKYINREDDIGDLGLRKAKESYHPAFMLEKYVADIF